MEQKSSGAASARVEAPVYSAAAFSNSVADIVPIAIPLWLAALGMEPFLIGLVVGARYIGPLVFSIQGGALMDRLGTRRVMIFFAVIATVAPLLYPAAGWLPFILCLQLVGGLAESLGWTGAQTLTNQVFRGDAVYAGRMIAATRVGTLLGPPVGGVFFEFLGPDGGFFAMSLWGLGTLLAVLLVPLDAVPKPEASRGRASDVLPKPADYVAAMRLLAVPVIATMMAVTSIRQIGSSMQSSFYTVYLENAGISETVIGLLIAMNGLAGIAAVWTGSLTQRIGLEKLLFWTIGLSILSIAAIPLSENIIFLFGMSAVRGFTLAVSVALLLAVLAREVGPEFQGRVIGLRMTCHQLLNVFVPIVLGAIIQLSGLASGFYYVGGAALAGLIGVALLRARNRGG